MLSKLRWLLGGVQSLGLRTAVSCKRLYRLSVYPSQIERDVLPG